MGLKEFESYCEDKGGGIEFGRSTTGHNLLLSQIYNNPSIIGINKTKSKYREVPLVSDTGADQVSVIDLVLITPSDKVYLCEVKSANRSGRGGMTQLLRQYEFVRDEFDLLPGRVLVRRPPGGKLWQRRWDPT